MSALQDKRVLESVNGAIMRMAQRSIDRTSRQNPREELDASSQSLDELAELLSYALPVNPENKATRNRLDADGTVACADRFGDAAQLGRFRLIRVLGHGGFGVVLLAFDPRLQREIALKLPRPELFATGRWRRRLFHEARSVASLDHPGIVPVFDIGRIGPVWYIASAYCSGPTLSQWRHEHASLPVKAAAELVAQIADAVQHAHSRGVLHRDLKPANVLLKIPTDGMDLTAPAALVADFGLASRKLPRGKWLSGSGLVGTLAYMAPEQTFDDQSQISAAVDVYALGAILFELLSDRPPFVAQDERVLIEQIRHAQAPSLRTLRPGLPRDLEAICGKCLAKDPTDRYESAAGLARDLRRFLAGHCVEARPVGRPQQSWRWCKRRPATAALVAGLLLAILCGGFASLREWRRAEANLRQAEQAVVNLGWAIDDSVFWHTNSDRYGPEQREELTRRYAALLEQLGNQPEAKPVRAAADCFFARLDVLDGKPETAKEKFSRSIVQWQKLVCDEPDNMFHRRALAKTLYAYGTHLLTIDGLVDGMEHFDGTRLLGQIDAASSPGQAIIFDYADLLFEKAEALRQRDIDVEAARLYAACIAICCRLTAANPHDANAQFRMAQSQVRLGLVHRPAASREEVYTTRTEALASLRSLVSAFPARHDYRLEHAKAATWLARRGGGGQGVKSDELLAEAKASLAVILASDDCPPEAKAEFGDLQRFIAIRKLEAGDVNAAIRCADSSLRWYDAAELEEAFSALPHANACRHLGGIYLKCGRELDALCAFERSVRLYEAARLDVPRNRGVHLQHADVYSKVSSLYEKSGRRAEALAAAQAAVQTLEAWRGAAPEEPHVALQLSRLRSDVVRLMQL